MEFKQLPVQLVEPTWSNIAFVVPRQVQDDVVLVWDFLFRFLVLIRQLVLRDIDHGKLVFAALREGRDDGVGVEAPEPVGVRRFRLVDDFVRPLRCGESLVDASA